MQPNEQYYFTFTLLTETRVGNFVSLSGDQNTFKNNVFNSLVDGTEIKMNVTIPEIKQKDFISDIRTMFNLYFYTDELAKKIYIEPRDEFYTDTALDWSDKIDKSKSKIISHLGDDLGDELIFKYANDSNDKYIITEEKKQDSEPYLSLTVDNTNKNGVDNKTAIQVNSFAPTYIGKGITTAGSANIPIIWNSETFDIPEKKVDKWKPRILYYRGRTSLPSGQYWRYEGKNKNYYPEFTINYIDGVYSNKHLNSLDFDSYYFGRGLYEKHWKNTIETINKSRKIEMYLKLNPTDILNLDFRKPILINDLGDVNYYHLETIHNYNPQIVGSYKCTFIKVINPTPIADWVPAEGEFITPPYIQNTIITEEIPENVPTESNMKVVLKVWQSTTDVPTGEFIDTVFDMKIKKLNANFDIHGSNRDEILKFKL